MLETVVLRDSASGTEAEIVPEFGFNCFRFLAFPRGEPCDVLWAEDAFADGTKRPSGSGIPLLFPFPGRIQGTKFVWGGEEYALAAEDGQGNAIHGFVHCRPWRIVEQEESRIVGQFQASVDDSKLAKQWPADFRITAEYQVEGNSLLGRYSLENPSDMTLPCGFGTHPYFRVPLGTGGNVDDCSVAIPVTSEWVLDGMNATGEKLPVAEADRFQAGIPFSEMSLDNVFGGLVFNNGQCQASIQDASNGNRVDIRFDQTFRECVVYNPPHREAVCIEPYTCVPDCFRLARHGVDAGMRELSPGEQVQARVEIHVA